MTKETYIVIAVECKCIPVSLTQTGLSAPGQNCFDKWRQQLSPNGLIFKYLELLLVKLQKR